MMIVPPRDARDPPVVAVPWTPPPPVGVAVATPYMPELESLRGIAMALVLLFHVDAIMLGLMLTTQGTEVPLWRAFVSAGDTGVSLFFVLSAFLLSLPFLVESAGGKRVARARYAGRRALRILPAYYVAVAAGTVLSAAHVRDLQHGLPYLLFLHGVPALTVSLYPYSAVWWSLATEAQLYVLLPLLPLALGTARGRRIGVGLLGAWAVAYLGFLLGLLPAAAASERQALALSIFGRAPLFLVGIGAAWIYLHHGASIRARLVRSRVGAWGGGDALLVLLVLALGGLLRWATRIGVVAAQEPPYHAWHVPEGVLWGAIVLLVLLVPLRAKALVDNRLWRHLGVVSYSVYLLHVPVLFWGVRLLRRSGWQERPWDAGTLAIAAGLVALCIGLAEVTYRTVERPFLARKRHLRP